MPTRILVSEHMLIEQVLDCLERMLERCASEGKLESAPARDAVAFFRGFTERCHCTKEETELLPTMRALGISPERYLGSSMPQRREEGRLHLDAMELSIEPAARGNPEVLKQFTEHARAYTELLMDYMAGQEDNLFPMICETLPEADKAQLRTRLDPQGRNGEERSECDTYVEIANRLADYFDVSRRVITDSLGNS